MAFKAKQSKKRARVYYYDTYSDKTGSLNEAEHDKRSFERRFGIKVYLEPEQITGDGVQFKFTAEGDATKIRKFYDERKKVTKDVGSNIARVEK